MQFEYIITTNYTNIITKGNIDLTLGLLITIKITETILYQKHK